MNTSLRALISVSDKTGVVEFAQALEKLGADILSTGGTAKALREAGVAVTDVSEVTGFPEIMDGRVKTLHPLIHGGLLGRGTHDQDVMNEHGITQIDVLAVNLYPFEATVANPDCTFAQAIENIDIGGPTMIRAAAKNHAHVAVVVDPTDYDDIAKELAETNGTISSDTRQQLAKKAFLHTGCYDAAIAGYLRSQDDDEEFPERLPVGLKLRETLRYGENPHQSAALYTTPGTAPGTLVAAEQLQGKPLSFNNIADANAALECVKSLGDAGCVIVKHANPCGVALNDDQIAAYQGAYTCDPTSAFGGIIAFNRPLTAAVAQAIIDQQFVEVVVAPTYEQGAAEVFASKPNIRVLACGNWDAAATSSLMLQQVEGGMLVQDKDIACITRDDLKIVSERQPSEQEITDALLAWKVARFVKSNAIVYGKDNTILGIGAGQMSRIMSAEIAGQKAAEASLELNGAAMASDAFFPFRDGIDVAAKYGIKVVIQPGGSMRDEEVIAAANEHGMAMLFTGMRHFRH
ncbi:MAG: bifunctional phosphoribosylaminoimidazolecarboxamide formyltransferase/IMP cyclohydrolase [Gammaproteobacteria bacterium]|nr:bifunctional phosphoribosylaminoimidazolecarboxamide formyltransferase/IMP cyclohydrolase [Gammaproteobacteria bacterium]MCP4276122.1 bifunctional phosphoribosylaminoimidazolecarboxamide formyltransferase/IMP cyclohydrolase [Gammaproteobacteria bacterium]MCP4830866.1 bifunctional phosphoribosylaminoimidazolecarboxamide formyltransferase/IMP cyclohydrolase [Gammaproteobacteria bacterium]MCP4929692.1 bifunctional phosphoribosylaminoimidazolecarboxamide formyltransferase/IMP cyclohydrolase [Gamm